MGPQCEDGYTKIANELLEALCRIPMGNSEGQIFLCILRKTYGWGKKQDCISISQIEAATGVSRRMVIYGVQNLEARKLLKVSRKKGRGVKNEINSISIQKNYSLWVVQGKSEQYKNTLEKQRVAYSKSKELVVQGIGSSARNDGLVVQGLSKKEQILAPTKETKSTKENTKENKPTEFLFPDWMPLDVWDLYIGMRKRIKKPLDPSSYYLAVAKLEKLKNSGHSPKDVLEQSVFHSWQGLFEVKEQKQTQALTIINGTQRRRTFADDQADRDKEQLRLAVEEMKNACRA